jgi:hypothetical protein
MPPDYSTIELLGLVRNLTREQSLLKARLDGLTTPVTEQSQLAYQQASDWLRMVNTITWALSSIFLVGAIIAINGASQSGVLPSWRLAAYVLVVILCLIWWRVDWVYTQSAIQAREKLVAIERGWDETNALYTSQNSDLWVRRRKWVALCVYLPAIAVGLVAAGLACQTVYAMLNPPASAQQQSETKQDAGAAQGSDRNARQQPGPVR